jgi:hypothetical protein
MVGRSRAHPRNRTCRANRARGHECRHSPRHRDCEHRRSCCRPQQRHWVHHCPRNFAVADRDRSRRCNWRPACRRRRLVERVPARLSAESGRDVPRADRLPKHRPHCGRIGGRRLDRRRLRRRCSQHPREPAVLTSRPLSPELSRRVRPPRQHSVLRQPRPARGTRHERRWSSRPGNASWRLDASRCLPPDERRHPWAGESLPDRVLKPLRREGTRTRRFQWRRCPGHRYG